MDIAIEVKSIPLAIWMMLHLRNVEDFDFPVVLSEEKVSSIAKRLWTLSCQSKQIAIWRCQLENCSMLSNFIFNVNRLKILQLVRARHFENLWFDEQSLSSIFEKVRHYLLNPISMDTNVVNLGSGHCKFQILPRVVVALDFKPSWSHNLVGYSSDYLISHHLRVYSLN